MPNFDYGPGCAGICYSDGVDDCNQPCGVQDIGSGILNTGIISTSPVHTAPNITITGSGATANISTLDKVLASIMSGVALVTHQPYVPTTIQPTNTYGGTGTLTQSQLATLQTASLQKNFGGQLQSLLQKNSGVVALAAVGLVVMLLAKKR